MKPTFDLRSPETDTDYVIFVAAPDATESTGPWPTVLFMDGDDQFSAAVEAYREQRKTGAVPPLLLVGVGYGASYAKPKNRRGRDYTPTAHGDEPTSGGATTFLSFLRLTLWPELGRRYPVHGDLRGIAGHSLGSLLVLDALWQEPLFFTHYLASAPSIWWDDRSILRLTSERHARNPALAAHLFLSVGTADSSSMTGDLTLLEQQLREHPFVGLHVVTQRFPGRNHFNVLPDAFRAGLATLFGHGSKSVEA
jgi:predicted alpha/beta superfamily hydrolase